MCRGTLVAAQRRAMLPVFEVSVRLVRRRSCFNTTNDSWWMFPTYNKHPLHSRIPPTTVGGLFNSSLSNNKKKRRETLEGLVVSFARPWASEFLCAGGRYVYCDLLVQVISSLRLSWFRPSSRPSWFRPSSRLLSFHLFLVAIASMCSFFRVWFLFSSRPQDTVLSSLLWARVNGAQHLAI